jgi:hypothetical protein
MLLHLSPLQEWNISLRFSFPLALDLDGISVIRSRVLDRQAIDVCIICVSAQYFAAYLESLRSSPR